MKATSLEQISSDYWSVMENKDIGLALLQKKEGVNAVILLFLMQSHVLTFLKYSKFHGIDIDMVNNYVVKLIIMLSHTASLQISSR